MGCSCFFFLPISITIGPARFGVWQSVSHPSMIVKNGCFILFFWSAHFYLPPHAAPCVSTHFMKLKLIYGLNKTYNSLCKSSFGPKRFFRENGTHYHTVTYTYAKGQSIPLSKTKILRNGFSQGVCFTILPYVASDRGAVHGFVQLDKTEIIIIPSLVPSLRSRGYSNSAGSDGR